MALNAITLLHPSHFREVYDRCELKIADRNKASTTSHNFSHFHTFSITEPRIASKTKNSTRDEKNFLRAASVFDQPYGKSGKFQSVGERRNGRTFDRRGTFLEHRDTHNHTAWPLMAPKCENTVRDPENEPE